MPLYELTHDALTPLLRTTMAQQDFRERDDLQRLLRTSIGVIDKNLLVLAEEFSQWEDSKRRIDLLALDKQANLVVIELKRTEDGGFMDLQSIRYAAMVSAMTFQQAVYEHARFLGDPANLENAKLSILKFLEWDDPHEDFASQVRIILTSADFSIELTTAVLWLNENGLDNSLRSTAALRAPGPHHTRCRADYSASRSGRLHSSNKQETERNWTGQAGKKMEQ
jgi:hypothetical protein